jgi:hypothetical protein
MKENGTSKWGSGVFLAAVGFTWGIISLVSGGVVIPFLRWQGIPLTNDIPVRGAPGILLALALIWFSLYLHFSYFWSRTPASTRFPGWASLFTGWAAASFLVAGLLVWLIIHARHAA